jgi:predicted nucleotidyltransferase
MSYDDIIRVIVMELTQSAKDYIFPAVSKNEDVKYPETKNIPASRTNTGGHVSGIDEIQTDYNSISNTLDIIKTAILKHVTAKDIYLFGSYAYGSPTNKSDIDIYIVVPDDTNNTTSLYVKIMTELNEKDIYFIDLLFGKESVFNRRRREYILEKTIYNKGRLLYES